MLIGKDELSTLIPHAGSMCLLDGVVAWDDLSITCVARTHLDVNNPLRTSDRLLAINAIEYGAQAAAVHGGLIARANGRRMTPGFLAGISEAKFAVDYLDDIPVSLTAMAHLLRADGAGVIYQVRIEAEGKLVAEARVSVLNRPDASVPRPGTVSNLENVPK